MSICADSKLRGADASAVHCHDGIAADAGTASSPTEAAAARSGCVHRQPIARRYRPGIDRDRSDPPFTIPAVGTANRKRSERESLASTPGLAGSADRKEAGRKKRGRIGQANRRVPTDPGSCPGSATEFATGEPERADLDEPRIEGAIGDIEQHGSAGPVSGLFAAPAQSCRCKRESRFRRYAAAVAQRHRDVAAAAIAERSVESAFTLAPNRERRAEQRTAIDVDRAAIDSERDRRTSGGTAGIRRCA